MSDESALHLGLADEKLNAARELLKQGFVRDAVSRAYYAMFHAGYALVRTKGLAPKTHRGLLMLLGQEFRGQAGLPIQHLEAFRRAQALREMGDYEATAAPSREDARRAIADASAFVIQARKMLQS